MSLGLYLHYPFCRNRCSYCDFYKELYDEKLEDQFFDALTTETDLLANEYANNRREVTSNFIGGGTPSLAASELLSDWLEIVKDRFRVSSNLEFSIETNPESVDLDLLQFYQHLGVLGSVFPVFDSR